LLTENVLPKGEWTVYYAFFSRRGFTQAAHQEAKGLQAQLVTLERLERDLIAWMKNRT